MKIHITAARLERDAWRFARRLLDEGVRPGIVVGITRGGAQIAVYLQEVFHRETGTPPAFATVHAASYTGIGEAGAVRVGSLEGVREPCRPGMRMLIVDDIFDRGMTFAAVHAALAEGLTDLEPTLELAALYHKPDCAAVDLRPDYVHQTFPAEAWLVFPHELVGLSEAELRAKAYPPSDADADLDAGPDTGPETPPERAVEGGPEMA